uniref:Uncharacterized protein n=1 Tax=Salvator merianae TaxID=96440 RepID=A0A8D0BN18_SALMN
MDLTHSSILAMSRLTGLTSNRIEDLAISPGFLDFFSAYCFSRSSLTRAASWSSSSSSLPNKSISSSSSAAEDATFFSGTAEENSTHSGVPPSQAATYSRPARVLLATRRRGILGFF